DQGFFSSGASGLALAPLSGRPRVRVVPGGRIRDSSCSRWPCGIALIYNGCLVLAADDVGPAKGFDRGRLPMPVRLGALGEGPDIRLDRTMVVVGRHPNCDTRLDSLRVSRHHCCMTQESGEVVVRDLGSTNGIRINGQRVEIGRLRPGDELSIAHIRYRL